MRDSSISDPILKMRFVLRIYTKIGIGFELQEEYDSRDSSPRFEELHQYLSTGRISLRRSEMRFYVVQTSFLSFKNA